ncbi:MAG: PAS domain S-box protein [Balneolia bacterium]|nr:PAS domain S-box protein [Balneolia bacterium]
MGNETPDKARSALSGDALDSAVFMYSVLDSASVAICISNPEARILEVNQALTELYGYSRDELIGSSVAMLVEESDAGKMLENHAGLFRTGSEPVPTYRIRVKNGNERYIRISGRLLEQPGAEKYRISTIQDISTEMAAQEQLHQTMSDLNERLKEQRCLHEIAKMDELDRSEEDIFKQAGRIISDSLKYVSGSAYCIEYNGTAYGHKDETPTVRYKAVSILSDDQRLTLEVFNKGADVASGSVRILPEEKKMIDSAADLLNVKMGRKLAVQQHEATNQDLRKIMDYSLDVICTMDEKLRFITVSQASELIFGYTPEELTGRSLTDFVHKADKKHIETEWDKVSSGTDLNEIVHQFHHKTTGIRTLLWSVHKNPEEQFFYCVAKDITERKDAEDRLLLSEKRFRALIQEGVEMICITDADGNYTYVSPSYEPILGYAPAELVGKNAFEIMHDDDRNFILSEFRKLGEGGKVRSSPYRIAHKNGRHIWMQSTGTNLLNDPAVKGFVINSINITEIERARQELLESERKLKRATQISKIGYWQLNLKTDKLYWSDEVYRMWGVDKNTFIPSFDSFVGTLHEDDRDEFLEHQQKVIEEGTPLDSDHRIVLPGGEIKWVRERAEVTLGRDGKAVLLEGTVQDITKKKQEEIHLKLLETVATKTADGILICREEEKSIEGLRILFANGAYSSMCGYPVAELLEQKVFFKLSPNGEGYGLNRLNDAVLAGKSTEETALLLNKNDVEYWVNIDMMPVRAGEKDDVQHWIIKIRDITKRKEQELRDRFYTDISIMFNKHNGLKDTFEELLRYLIVWSDFEIAEIWLVAADRKRINYIAGHAEEDEFASFIDASRSVGSFLKDEALPGKVWATIKEELWYDIDTSKGFVRRKAAAKCGLKTAYAVPLFDGGDVTGVLQFTSKNNSKKLNFYDLIMKELSGYLGREIKRKQLEEEMSNIFNVATDIICIAGMDGYYKRINPAASKLTGYSESELLSTPLLEFIHPEDRQRSVENFRHLLDGGEVDYFENRFITKNGEVIWLAWTSSPVPEDGRIYAIAKDITSNKKLEQTLDKASEISRMGGWETDMVKQTISWTPMMRELHEVDDNYVPGFETGLSFFKEGESREMLQFAIDEALENGKSWDLELEFITAKGNHRWVRFIGDSEMRDGKCVRQFGSMQDITKRKEAEIKALRQASYLEAIAAVIELFLATEDVVHAFEDAFDITASTLGADRMYLFEQEADSETGELFIRHEYHWCRENIESLAGNPRLERIPVASYEKPLKQLMAGETLIVYTETADAEQRQMLESLDIKSQIAVPLFIVDKWIGFIVVDNCTDNLEWTNGEISFMQTIGKNLAAAYQRKEHVLAIEKSNTEKETILETIGDGFFTTNIRFTVSYWNGVAEETTGVKREEIVGRNLWSVFSDDDALKIRKRVEEAFHSGRPVHMETYYDPLKMWAEISIYPGGDLLAVYFRNINERKKAEQTLRESNERFLKATEATNDAIWDWDLVENRLWWGEGFRNLFGWETGVVGDNMAFRSKVHPDDREQLSRVIQSAFDNSHIDFLSDDFRFLKADGTYAYVTDRASVVRNEKGEVIRLIGAVTDITHRKMYEESLRSLNRTLEQRANELAISNQELEQFAYVASHDLQEPLRMVSSFLTQLERKYGTQLDERAHTYIHYAVDGAKRMRQIILDLLEYSRVTKEDGEPELIDLNELMGEVLLLSNRLITEKDAEISVEVLPKIYSQRAPVVQVFQNLINNALKYSREGVKPEISVSHHPEHEGEEHLFSISDNGLGIGAEFYEKIFIMFQRLHPKDEFSGTGMGLAIVKKILESLGGSIWVESEVGKESVFYFTLKKYHGADSLL